jgi:hypothetical protein
VANDLLTKDKLNDALKEQSISNLEEYVIYHKMLNKRTMDVLKQKLGLY